MAKEFKIRTRNPELFLRVQKGHFATMHSHTNYYIDVTTQKYRMAEAKAVAREIVSFYRSNTIIDTIICIDGTEIIGAFLAQELTDACFMNLNAHQTIYILSPEFIGNGQMVFRDNTSPQSTRSSTTAVISSAYRRYSRRSPSATATPSPRYSTPTTSRALSAASRITVRCVRRARSSRRW